MATYNSYNYTNSIAVPIEKSAPGWKNGKVRCLVDYYTFSGAVLALNDLILFEKLPKGATVIDATMESTDAGGTGKFSLGFAANGVDAEDLDAFITEVDAGAAAAKGSMPVSAAGFQKNFTAETQVKGKVTEATTATAGTVKIVIWYTAD